MNYFEYIYQGSAKLIEIGLPNHDLPIIETTRAISDDLLNSFSWEVLYPFVKT